MWCKHRQQGFPPEQASWVHAGVGDGRGSVGNADLAVAIAASAGTAVDLPADGLAAAWQEYKAIRLHHEEGHPAALKPQQVKMKEFQQLPIGVSWLHASCLFGLLKLSACHLHFL